MMFYNEDQAIKVCISNPVMIFELIKEGYTEVVDKLLTTNKELINTIDENGNSVMMRLLNKKDYSIVLKHSKNKYWDVNHQNKDKNTLTIQDKGIGMIAAALAVGLAAIGSGIAVAVVASSAVGAISENPSLLGKTVIFAGLAEGIAIYGLIISIMILSKI